jgi:hypothetical protein
MPVDDLHKAPRVRGRPFEKGNGGRKSGAKNRTTLVAQALLRGEEVELVRKAIELAKAGDIQMLNRSVRVEGAQWRLAASAGMMVQAVGSTSAVALA